MKNQVDSFKQIIDELALRDYTKKSTLQLFQKRIGGDVRLTREENVSSHFCALFSPVCVKEQKVFIGHHIKSDSWLSPGGHIDKGESPLKTVVRECREELGYSLTNEIIELFHITHFDNINRPMCAEHYDFWYIILFDTLVSFEVDTHEFREAGWYTIDEALTKKSLPVFKKELRLLREYIEYN